MDHISQQQQSAGVADTPGQSREDTWLGGWARFAVAALPAGAVTFALFLAMDAAISSEMPEAEPGRVIELVPITPTEELTAARRTPRVPAEKLILAAAPPPPPALNARKGDIDLPGVVMSGAAPDLPRFERLGQMVPPLPAISAREARPVRAPVPSYPDMLARRGVEGDCDVSLKIDRLGQPFDISASCTHAGFERSAVRAVASVQFVPRIVRGEAVEQHGVVYPIQYRLEN